jgi:DNA-binding NarL/FixJ family response regulator
MKQLVDHDDRPTVVVVDVQDLRREGVVEFLRSWAESSGLAIQAADPGDVINTLDPGLRYVLGVLSIGSASLVSPLHLGWLANLRRAIACAPVAVLSDLEDPAEALAAFQSGARAFLPANTEPAVALHTLSYLLRGGSFFPPSALLGLNAMLPSPRPLSLLDRQSGSALPPPSPHQPTVLEFLQADMSNRYISTVRKVRKPTFKN